MRKIRLLLVAALVLFLPFMVNVKAETKEKINVYLFRGEGCPHCAEAEEFFDELSKDEEYKEYYTLVDYEVWQNKDNAEFMEKVGNALNTSVTGVPFIVIGDKYYNGYSSAMADQIKETIKDQYNKEDYKDVVQELKDKEKEKEEETSNTIVPIVIVSAAALIVVVAMVFFTKEK